VSGKYLQVAENQKVLIVNKAPKTRGKIEIKIYPPYAQGMLKFRSLGERVFKPFS